MRYLGNSKMVKGDTLMMLLPNYSPVKKKDTAVKVQPTNK